MLDKIKWIRYYHKKIEMKGGSMFYLLASHINIFRYITLRTGGAFLTSFLICLLFGAKFIEVLRKKQSLGQPIRDYGPKGHLSKQGTPTMGGIMILIAILISVFLWGNLSNLYILILLGSLVAFGLIGLADDYLKLVMESYNGIKSTHKLFCQFMVAFIACSLIMYLAPSKMSTVLTFPFFKNFVLDLGYFYLPFSLIVVVGASNAVNLTDGLDGLVSFPIVMVAFVFLVISYLVGRPDYAQYLQVYHVSGGSEISVFCGAVIGSVLGFLWFNAYPAKVFMGDTGSLALGGVLGIISVILKHEIVLAIAGAIFVIEALSVMLQVMGWKVFKKPILLMAPLHHHFEKKGFSETVIVTRFWIISILLAILALSTLKIR